MTSREDKLKKKMSRDKHYIITLGCCVLFAIGCAFWVFHENNKHEFRHDYRTIAEYGYLRVIAEENEMSFQAGDTGSVKGLQALMIEEFAKAHGLEVRFVQERDLSTAIDMLLDNKVDLLAWHIPVYDYMKSTISYSIPVFTSRQMLIQRNKDRSYPDGFIRNQLDLAHREIYVQKGSIFKQRLLNLSKEIGDSISIVEIPNTTPEILFHWVDDSTIDYSVCDEFVARVLQKKYPGVDIKTAVSFTQNYSWGLNPGATDLLDSINSWLEIYLESKEYNKIYREYTGAKHCAISMQAAGFFAVLYRVPIET